MLHARSLLTLAAAVVLVAGCGDDDGAPDAQSDETASATEAAGADGGESGGEPFSLVHMSHTFADDAHAWDGSSDDGTYTYISAPCNFDAPVNNNATNLPTFNARMEGTSSPASTRFQPLEFEVTPGEDGAGELQGTIRMTVCQLERGPTPEDDPVPDAEKDHISFDFNANYQQTSDEEVAWDGTFDITGGSGTYEELTGSGELSGYFTCAFTPDDCADTGEFSDLQLVMIGRYEHPEVSD